MGCPQFCVETKQAAKGGIYNAENVCEEFFVWIFLLDDFCLSKKKDLVDHHDFGRWIFKDFFFQHHPTVKVLEYDTFSEDTEMSRFDHFHSPSLFE